MIKYTFLKCKESIPLLFISVTVKLYNYYVVTGDNLSANSLKHQINF